MKLSRKILIIGFSLPIIAVIISIGILSTKETDKPEHQFKNVAKILLGSVGGLISGDNFTAALNKESTKEYSFESFNKIVLKGAWNLNIIESDNYNIQLHGSFESMDQLDVQEKDNTLIIKQKGAFDRGVISGDISLPALRELIVEGAGNITIRDQIYSESLRVEAEGFVNINSYNFYIESLSLNLKGAVNCYFRDGAVNTLNLNYSSIGDLNVNLDDGVLLGKMKESGKVIFTGEIKTNSLIIR